MDGRRTTRTHRRSDYENHRGRKEPGIVETKVPGIVETRAVPRGIPEWLPVVVSTETERAGIETIRAEPVSRDVASATGSVGIVASDLSIAQGLITQVTPLVQIIGQHGVFKIVLCGIVRVQRERLILVDADFLAAFPVVHRSSTLPHRNLQRARIDAENAITSGLFEENVLAARLDCDLVGPAAHDVEFSFALVQVHAGSGLAGAQ